MKTKTVKVFLTFLITIILAAAFIACDPVGGGGGGGGGGSSGGSGGSGGGGTGGGGGGGSGTKVTLNIHLPRNNSRSAWLHDSDPSVLDRLDYNITLSGNGETISLTKKGGGTVQVTVSVGYWTLSVNAFYNGSLYALGSTTVNVIVGANDVSLLLEKPPEPPVPPDPPELGSIGNPIIFNVTNDPEMADAIAEIKSGDNNKHYEIRVPTGTSVGMTTPPTDTSNFAPATGVTVTLTGGGTITYAAGASNYYMFIIGTNNTLVLKNITIQGKTNSRGVISTGGGKLIMEVGAVIQGNSSTTNAGTVYLANGIFIMNGGLITDNSTTDRGGGVLVPSDGIFTMNGGTITNNTAPVDKGGGVYVISGGVFNNNYPTGIYYNLPAGNDIFIE